MVVWAFSYSISYESSGGLIAVFSTREKAIAYAKKHIKDQDTIPGVVGLKKRRYKKDEYKDSVSWERGDELYNVYPIEVDERV